MKALSVTPGLAGSAAVEDLAGLDRAVALDGGGHPRLIVDTLAVGVCGTDAEIVAGLYGTPPPGHLRLVLGHEAVGRVRAVTGEGLGFAPRDRPEVSPGDRPDVSPGDLIVPIVRRPDPVPCSSCAVDEWDMCRNGLYTEHGIGGADGFARPAFDLDPRFAVVVPPALGDLAVLLEPASVVAKAWEQIERIGGRASWAPRTVLVIGAGPIGLLAALLSRQRGYVTHVLDRVTDGPKPALVADLGACYHSGTVADTCAVAGAPADIVLECTGIGQLVLDAMAYNAPVGIVCLTGLSSGARQVELDAAALNRRLVLENDVVFGTVNANRRHYQAAVEALAAADPAWLARLVTRRVPLDRWAEAFTKQPDDVKVVLTFP